MAAARLHRHGVPARRLAQKTPPKDARLRFRSKTATSTQKTPPEDSPDDDELWHYVWSRVEANAVPHTDTEMQPPAARPRPAATAAATAATAAAVKAAQQKATSASYEAKCVREENERLGAMIEERDRELAKLRLDAQIAKKMEAERRWP